MHILQMEEDVPKFLTIGARLDGLNLDFQWNTTSLEGNNGIYIGLYRT